jgi:hypothetical protein
MVKYSNIIEMVFNGTKMCLIIVMMFFIGSCQSKNSQNTDNNVPETAEKIAYVVNTAQDFEKPWLAFRAEPKYDGKLIYMLPDGTRLRILGEDNTGNFVKVELIDNIGYVSKKYLSDNLTSSNQEQDILSLTKTILGNLKKGNISILSNYMYGSSMDFFYWRISKTQFQNGSYRNLPDYNGTNSISGQPFTEQISNYLDFGKWNMNNLTNSGQGFFPASGFGGGSMTPPDKEDYIIRVADPNRDMPGSELWFVFKKVNNTFQLKTIGTWEWTP